MSGEPLIMEPTTTSAKRTRLPSVLLGVLGGLMVLAVLWLVFFAQDATGAVPEASGEALLATEDAAPASPQGTPEVVLDLEALPVVTYDVYLARDPFEPVVEEEAPANETAIDGGPVPGGVVPVDGVTPIDPLDPVPGYTPGEPVPIGTATGTCTGQVELVCDGRVVSLLSVSTRNGERVATLQVGEDVYEVAHGEVFAGTFRVVEFISETTIRLQYGELIYEISSAQRSMK